MCSALLLWSLGCHACSVFFTNVYLPFQYGQARLYSTQVVLHLDHDSQANPSRIASWTENGRIRILVEPAGDLSQSRIIDGSQVIVPSMPVVEVKAEDLNGDGIVDLDLEVVTGQLTMFFQPEVHQVTMYGDGHGGFSLNLPQSKQ
jgi:hypothetical protein